MRRLLAAATLATVAATAVLLGSAPAHAHRICDTDLRPCWCDDPVTPLHLRPC